MCNWKMWKRLILAAAKTSVTVCDTFTLTCLNKRGKKPLIPLKEGMTSGEANLLKDLGFFKECMAFSPFIFLAGCFRAPSHSGDIRRRGVCLGAGREQTSSIRARPGH